MLSNVKKNKSIYALGIAGVIVVSVLLTINFAGAESLAPQNITYSISRDGAPFSAFSSYNVQQKGNANFNWSATITNNGPGDMHLVAMGFHSDAAGNSPTIEHGFSIDKSGKDDYVERESGTFNFSFNTNKYDCGRVQIDGGFIDERYPTYHDTNFFAILIDYGVDCTPSIPTPTPTPTPTQILTPIISVPACSNVDYVAQISYPSVNNNIRIFIDDEISSPSAWDKTLDGLSGHTTAPTGFSPRLAGMPALVLHPGVRYYSFIQNSSSIDGPMTSWIVERCSTPPTPTPTPTPTSSP